MRLPALRTIEAGLILAWGYFIDGLRPDRWEVLGAAICMVGVLVIFFGPRGATP